MSRWSAFPCVLLFLLSAGALDTATAQSSPYVVDGLALGGKVRFDSQAYEAYRCTPSDISPGLTWCHKEKTETANRGACSSNSILHDQDGTAVYVNCYSKPAFFGANDLRAEIDRLSAKFRERPREFRMPRREGLPDGIIASWGKIELEELSAADVSVVASGGSIKGLLVSFLGDLQRSAKAGLPVYQLAGGAGYLLAASQDGQGTLRILTIDASLLAPPIATQNPRVSRLAVAGAAIAEPSEFVDAWNRGDYSTAYWLDRQLADQGYAPAQLSIGGMYRDGKGVPQNFTEAIRWLRKAADQGGSIAQFELGDMYYNG
jgi:hypothetical protein